MYTKEESSQLRQAFWTAFGKYMSPILSAEGVKTNWINYNTGIKYIYFKMQAGNNGASISIEINHPDPGIQELFFEQFKEYRSLLHGTLGEDWQWQLHAWADAGKIVSTISTNIEEVSVYRQDDWPALISFFKPRIIALDVFWSDAKYGFDALT